MAQRDGYSCAFPRIHGSSILGQDEGEPLFSKAVSIFAEKKSFRNARTIGKANSREVVASRERPALSQG